MVRITSRAAKIAPLMRQGLLKIIKAAITCKRIATTEVIIPCKYKLYGDDLEECDICHYWYFFGKGFKSQRNVCNECCDILMRSINLNDIAILNIQGVDYNCIISSMNKSDTINVLQKDDLTEEKGVT